MTNRDDPAFALARARKFLTEDDVEVIERLTREAQIEAGPRPIFIVDLGAGSGTTALAVFCAEPSAIVAAFDIDRTAAQWAMLNVRGNFPDVTYLSYISRADQGTHLVDAETIDLLLHDAGHEREDVLRDVRAWLPRLRSGAAVWVHDYAPAPWQDEHYPGVKEAVEELIASGDLEFVETSGLGWVGCVPEREAE